MHDRIDAFKAHVKRASANPKFRHHTWFVKYHLEIVERIASELLTTYTDADVDIVMVLVWLHDFGKTLDYDNQYETTLTAGRSKLNELGFDDAFIETVVGYAALIDQKLVVDLHEAPIEVQIVSSADAASHHVGPFFHLYWWENSNMTPEELMASNRAKTMKDWERKMVLPEVRNAFEARHKAVLEHSGEFPAHFLS